MIQEHSSLSGPKPAIKAPDPISAICIWGGQFFHFRDGGRKNNIDPGGPRALRCPLFGGSTM